MRNLNFEKQINSLIYVWALINEDYFKNKSGLQFKEKGESWQYAGHDHFLPSISNMWTNKSFKMSKMLLKILQSCQESLTNFGLGQLTYLMGIHFF